MTTVVQGARAAGPQPYCRAPECQRTFGPFESYRLVDGRLPYHPACVSPAAPLDPQDAAERLARLRGRCSVCDAPTPADALDASARCEECRP